MRKRYLLPAAVILISFAVLLLLGGCSLDYSEMETDGAYSYACGKKTAFLYEYSWDGTDSGLEIDVPDTCGGRRVVAVGGFFGRGLPMPFRADISEWITGKYGSVPDVADFSDEETEPAETVTLNFSLRTGSNVKDFHLSGPETWYVRDGEGNVIRYVVNIIR